MEFLLLQEIIARREEIRKAFDRLMSNRVLVARSKAYQWQFFREAFDALFFAVRISPMQYVSAVRAAQFKFEVEDRLRRFYLRSGRDADYVFTLVHKSRLADYGIGVTEQYPSLSGYSVLIRDLASDRNSVTYSSPADEKLYVERVVSESIDAEYRAYELLPEVVVENLRRWFIQSGPAYKEILNILTRHQKRRWIISNPLNPSTKRLLKINVRKLGVHEAVVNTMEYWYLRWWDEKEESYVYPYRETNRQTYILRKDAEGWKVHENLRPLPRTSIAFKGWHRKQIKH